MKEKSYRRRLFVLPRVSFIRIDGAPKSLHETFLEQYILCIDALRGLLRGVEPLIGRKVYRSSLEKPTPRQV